MQKLISSLLALALTACAPKAKTLECVYLYRGYECKGFDKKEAHLYQCTDGLDFYNVTDVVKKCEEK